jgi:hypothetical protein
VYRRRNAKGQLEDYGTKKVELPSNAETPAGWVRADSTQHSYAPSSHVVFDPAGRPQPGMAPLSGTAAVTTILKFYNLTVLERQGKLKPEKVQEKRALQVQLRDPPNDRGLRNWMRIPVSVDVRLGPSSNPGRMIDISAGGIRLDLVQGRFMVGTRLEVRMPFAVGDRHGTIVFATRVAWANDMRQTLGLEFTSAPRWRDK